MVGARRARRAPPQWHERPKCLPAKDFGHGIVTVDDHDLIRKGLRAVSALFVSDSTAKTHISKLYEKLGAANRAKALMIALRLGLLQAPDAPNLG